MKYSINARQKDSVLAQADEIFVEGRDSDIIFDLIDKYPDKSIVLEINSIIDLDKAKMFSEKYNGTFYIELSNLSFLTEVNNKDLKWFYKYPATNFYELNGLIDAGASYVRVDGPLFFALDKITTIPVRLSPNIAYESYIPRDNGITGTWIRPEDIETYEPYCDIMEFTTYKNYKKEATLFDIYKNDQKWEGNLKLLIDNLDYNCENSLVFKEIAETRLRCGQRCQQPNYSCHLCKTALDWGLTVYNYQKNSED